MLKRGFQFAPGYKLQEFLGRGQFGQVWRATAPGGAALAAKFIDLSDGQGQKEYDAVRRVKQIRHANLMPITAIWLLDAEGKVIEEAPDEAIETIDLSVAEPEGQSVVYHPEEEPNWLVVAMLLGGKSLQQRLRESVDEGLPGIPPKELISYMDESAKGLDFLNSPQHDLGEGPIAIQHSDVKPANIVLIGSSAVVCDFGLARILSRNQVTATSAAGTPAYMAPEAISGKPSRTSDQYSLAVTYYHLRTGSLPMNDGSLWEVLDAHRQGNLKLGLVPEAEQEALRKATELDWENRFDSCVEMVEALREALRVEGHTKPGFVPHGTHLGAVAVADGETKPVGGDVTATRDLAVEDAQPETSVKATAPWIPTEQSTKGERFLDATLPSLQDRREESAATEIESGWKQVSNHPKLLTAVITIPIALIAVAAMVLWPDAEAVVTVPETTEETSGGPDPDPEVEKVETQNPDVLALEAASQLDSDEELAVETFKTALQADANLADPEVLTLSGHREGSVMWMLQSADGSRLISLARDPEPLVWELDRGSHSFTSLGGHQKAVVTMTLSHGGHRLLTGGRDYEARAWDLKATDVAASGLVLKGHAGPIEASAWHPEGSIAATASTDQTMRIWQFDKATQESPMGTVTGTRVSVAMFFVSLASDFEGTWLAARSLGAEEISREDDDVLVYRWSELIDDVENVPQPVKLQAPEAKKIEFLRGDGEPLLVSGDAGGTVSIYDPSDGSLVIRINDAHDSSFDVEAMRVIDVDQRDVIVTGSADGSVHWWKYGATSQRSRRHFCDLGISSVDVSADGRWVAAGDNQGSVWLWDTTAADEDAGTIRLVTGASAVDSVLIDVNARWLIAGCGDSVIRMWDLNRIKLLALTQPTPPLKPIDGTIRLPQLSMR